MNISMSSNKQSKFDANQLIRYSTLKSIQQVGSYYNKNKSKLPPILQSRQLFIQQIKQRPLEDLQKHLEQIDSQESQEKQPQKQSQTERINERNGDQIGENGFIQIKPKIGLIIFDRNHKRKIKRESLISYCLSTKNRSNSKNSNPQQSIIRQAIFQSLAKQKIKQNDKKQNQNSIITMLDKMQHKPNIELIHKRIAYKKIVFPNSLIMKKNQNKKRNNPINETLNCRQCTKYEQKVRQNTEIKNIPVKQSSRDHYIKTSQCQIEKLEHIAESVPIKLEQPIHDKHQKNTIGVLKRVPQIETIDPWDQETPNYDYSIYIRNKE